MTTLASMVLRFTATALVVYWLGHELNGMIWLTSSALWSVK